MRGIWYEGRLCGFVSLSEHHDGQGWEISYMLHPDCCGKGLGSEALGVWINCLVPAHVPHVFAETQLLNQASIKLLERLGFSLVREFDRFGARQGLYIYQ